VEHGKYGKYRLWTNGITEDYLMWFSFMYSLQSDYYLVFLILLIPTSHYLYLVWSGHLFVSCLSFPLVLVRLPIMSTNRALEPSRIDHSGHVQLCRCHD